jgi:hypothetical protein
MVTWGILYLFLDDNISPGGQQAHVFQGTGVYFSIVAKLPEFQEFFTATSKKEE